MTWVWFTFLVAQTLSAQESLPAFDQFAVQEVFHGQPATPILRTRQDRLFRTSIREGAAKGPNFAGHYTIADWGCGTSCESAVMVDAKNGAIQRLPFSMLGYGENLKFADGKSVYDQDFDPLLFNLKSRLLIVHGCPEEENCGAYYYEWTGSQFRQIGKFAAVPISVTP